MSRRQKIKSANWQRQQENDWHVQRARQLGYRSRAVHKLIQIDQQVNLLKGCRCVVDLGCAPGSWSQVLAARLPKHCNIIAVDILGMAPLAGVKFIQGDFLAPDTQQQIIDKTTEPIDVIVADMAPNLTGISAVDSENVFNLNKGVIDFADAHLRAGGRVLFKSFENENARRVRQLLGKRFASVQTIRPGATRRASAELFFYANGKV